MPTLVRTSKSVISQPDQHENSKTLDPVRSRAVYAGEPLSIRPSDYAPRRASIVSRVAEHGVAVYLLQIGDIQIPDVGLHEILDYVSAYELEQFENQQFEEERTILRIAEAELEAELEADHERQKERAKRKGRILIQEQSDGSSDELADVDVPTGRHGRARPSYAHLYKAQEERRRRRRRDPETGELLPLSDDPVLDPIINYSSEDDAGLDVPKRRRRKRDKITGELLPLSPKATPVLEEEHSKRPRRRRHPITRELMPLGWRYDPAAQDEREPLQRSQIAKSALQSSRSDGLDASHDMKRLKLASDTRASSSTGSLSTMTRQPQPARDALRRNPEQLELLHPSNGGDTKAERKFHYSGSSVSDDSEPVVQRPNAVRESSIKLQTSITKPRKQVTLASFLSSSRPPRSPSESPEDDEDDDQSKPVLARRSFPQRDHNGQSRYHRAQDNESVKSTPRKTSIMHPVASADDIVDTEPGKQSGEDSLDEGEWFVEAILDHHMSDPRTHPPELGKQPVVLYLTKWQDFETPTWEPSVSFVDQEMLEEYRQHAGLIPIGGTAKKQPPETNILSTSQIADASMYDELAMPIEDDDDDDNEEEDYEIEAILSHHVSDPKTHPTELGKKPVMLYLVKWAGYEEATWEPIESFIDRSIVEDYNKRIRARTTPNPLSNSR